MYIRKLCNNFLLNSVYISGIHGLKSQIYMNRVYNIRRISYKI